jgi:hypothetical protein
LENTTPTRTQEALREALEALPISSPELLADRALLKRVDTKFALRVERLPHLLSWLEGRYAVVRAANAPFDRYETTYFDTQELSFLNQHLRDRRPRYKVRIRHYQRRHLSYLELKQKTPANVTRKWRRELPFGQNTIDAEGERFLDELCPVPARALRPTANTNFDRIMLVGLDTMERVTLDVGLEFVAGSAERGLGPIVIAEVKQDRQRWRTPIMLALRAHQVRPLSVSKYCVAAALLIDGARVHRYRPRLREIHRISQRSA